MTEPFIASIAPTAIEWVYNILDGKKEVEHVLASDEDMLVVKDYKWSDESKVEAMHLLGMPKGKGVLRSIRDLRAEHIPLLQKIKQAGLQVLHNKYQISPSSVRSYFHYLPTFYHLHVHFDHIAATHAGVNVAKAILLDDVIDWLQQDGDYFRKASLTFAAGAVRDKEILSLLAAKVEADAAVAATITKKSGRSQGKTKTTVVGSGV